ncbi:hypothetical protein Tco_0984801, partial [Tanacetum coccineum]
IMEYLVNISKRRAFWSLNEDILKITILKTNTPYPSRKIRHIRACTHQRPQSMPYPEDLNTPVSKIICEESTTITLSLRLPAFQSLRGHALHSKLFDEKF